MGDEVGSGLQEHNVSNFFGNLPPAAAEGSLEEKGDPEAHRSRMVQQQMISLGDGEGWTSPLTRLLEKGVPNGPFQSSNRSTVMTAAVQHFIDIRKQLTKRKENQQHFYLVPRSYIAAMALRPPEALSAGPRPPPNSAK